MNRRARRRLARGSRPAATRRVRRLDPATRALILLGGFALIAAGIFLLAHPTGHSAGRLARVAGMMLLFGLVGVAAAAYGRL